MDASYIASLRLLNQQIHGTTITHAKDLVGYMGAMQAQDFVMAKWAIGLRMEQADDSKITHAINNGDIIRTHVMRPTWHFVSCKDIYWMLDLTGKKIRNSLKSRHKQLELDTETINKSLSIIEKLLGDHPFLSREAIGEVLVQDGIQLNLNRLSHLMLCAELDSLVCNGKFSERKQTYALLSKWVPKKNMLSRDEALATLVNRYFSSHGPATLEDFVWWSGLSLSEARVGIEYNKHNFEQLKTEHKTYYFKPSPKLSQSSTLFFLPAYDEFLISYKNREASIHEEGRKKAISINGIFRPVIVFNGKVIGLWKRTLKGDTLSITTNFFDKPKKEILNLLEPTAKKYGDYLGVKKVTVSKNLLT